MKKLLLITLCALIVGCNYNKETREVKRVDSNRYYLYTYYPNGEVQSINFFCKYLLVGDQRHYNKKGLLDSSFFIYHHKIPYSVSYYHNGFIKRLIGSPIFLVYDKKSTTKDSACNFIFFVYTNPNYRTDLKLSILNNKHSNLYSVNVQSFDSANNCFYYYFQSNFRDTGFFDFKTITTVTNKVSNKLIISDSETFNIMVK